jgi:hypothetical protein
MMNTSAVRANQRPRPSPAPSQILQRLPLWKQALAFMIGFCIQFNVLVGGSGEGALTTGGYGFRIFDYLAVVLIVLLCLQGLVISRLLSLIAFCLMGGMLALIRILEPSFWSDPRTVILGVHYVFYLFAGLYVAILLAERAALDKFCWGLIFGLLATVPIFIVQGSGYSSALVNMGLVPGYYEILSLTIGDTARYSGLWGHPNEAGHIAAIAAAAGAYFAAVYRRYVPLILVGCALIIVFYYTQSRGGLLAGEGILVLSFLFGRAGQISLVRLIAAVAVMMIAIKLATQLEFVAWRFEDDPSTSGNFAERLSSILAGLQVGFTHPFGLSLQDFDSIIDAETNGVGSPHDGFIFFSAIFGFLPFAVLIAAFITNLRVRTDVDSFFAFATLQVSASFMFEVLPLSYPFVFMMCLIVSRAYLKTPIGRPLITRVSAHPGRLSLQEQSLRRMKRFSSVRSF